MNMRAIAREAGVSSATVSRVLNGSPLVKEATAQRVREVLTRTRFIPNPVATTLKYGRSKTYGLVIPDLRNPFYSEFLCEFEDLMAEIDHELLLTNVESNMDKLARSVRRMLMRQVDGAVLMPSEFETRSIEQLLDHKVPLVTVDRRMLQTGCSDVALDYDRGFHHAIEHLHQLGHRKIAFVGGTEGLRTSTLRLEAFCSALTAHGLTVHPRLLRAGNYSVDGGDTAMASLLLERVLPTAVLTANDLTAFGVMRCVHARGMRVPEDVSVIGLDDILLDTVVQPPLTTIRIPRRRMAQTCLRALEHIKADVTQEGAQFLVPTELVGRASTAVAKG